MEKDTNLPESRVLECGHCGNRTPHIMVAVYAHQQLFEKDVGEDYYLPFTWVSYACGTCGGLSLYGNFYSVYGIDDFERTRLHPRASMLLPPSHMLSPSAPIPERIVALYEEIWPLRHRTPAAFVGQTRRLLEYICSDQKAAGKTLFDKLQNLVSAGIFPGWYTHTD